jgi:hypothetical protein
MIRARGTSATACNGFCSQQATERGCSREVNGYAYSFCSRCSDLTQDPKCTWGVRDVTACEAGCAAGDLEDPPTPAPTPAPTLAPTAAPTSAPTPGTTLNPAPPVNPVQEAVRQVEESVENLKSVISSRPNDGHGDDGALA